MFHFIRRHQFWSFLLISLVIVSFVIFLAPSTPRMPGGGQVDFGSIEGKKIGREEYQDAFAEVRLAYFFRYGNLPGNDPRAQKRFNEDRETLNRLLLNYKQRDLGIDVPIQSVAKRVTEIFQNQEGQFQKSRYSQLLTNLRRRAGIQKEDFQRFLRHEIGTQHLVSLVGVSGALVTPQEAKENFRRENRQAKTEVVVFSISNHLDSVTIEPDALSQFYTNRSAMYRTRKQIQLSYVKFPETNYLDQAQTWAKTNSNLGQQINAYYQQQGTNSFTNDEGKPLPEKKAKEQIENRFKEQRAKLFAKRAAYDFLNQVYDQGPSLETLEKLAAAKGYSVNETEPFSRRGSPSGINATNRFTSEAFDRTPQQPIGTPVAGEDAFYVYGLKRTIPSEVPPLKEVRDEVVADYRRQQAQKMTEKEGTAFYNTLTNAMAQGKSFAAVAKEEGKELYTPPPFSLTTRKLPDAEVTSKISFSSLKNTAFNLKPGDVSELKSSRRNSFIVHLKQFDQVSDEKLNKELTSYMEDMRNQRRYAAFNEWVRQEMNEANLRQPGAGQGGDGSGSGQTNATTSSPSP